MQERRILVCRFGEEPNAVDIVGIKDKHGFKQLHGVNHRFDDCVTLRIKSCESPCAHIDINITRYHKKTIILNESETSTIECHGDIYVCHKKHLTNKAKLQYVFERKKLAATITLNVEVLTPRQLSLQYFQSITFMQSTPVHAFENFFDYFMSEIDAYQKEISLQDNETLNPFKEPLPVKRKIALV